MNDLGPILALWHELEAAHIDYVLATILHVDGPSYRKVGARMLVSSNGRRAGTISGGCLEDELSRRAFWLTQNGPVVEQFSTRDDDGERPYGSGCGGLLHILLEQHHTAQPTLEALDFAYTHRLPAGIATITAEEHIACRAVAIQQAHLSIYPVDLAPELAQALTWYSSQALNSPRQVKSIVEEPIKISIEHAPARTGLWIFGAGNDAQPLVRIADELGWFVAVADGRSKLATPERFPHADAVLPLTITNHPAAPLPCEIKPTDAVVVMTHSFEQDSRILAALFSNLQLPPPQFVGVLGPKRRTRELLEEATRLLGLTADAAHIDKWLATLHSPVGLDLAAADPAAIALSILAEIEQQQHNSSARPLREVR
jgi:xanthine/CO dehydrogenase XdhC/CoxF family maturation factor